MKEIKIEGMSCKHCVASITKALNDLPGVEKVEVSLEDKNAKLWGDVDSGDIIKTIEKLGFSAS